MSHLIKVFYEGAEKKKTQTSVFGTQNTAATFNFSLQIKLNGRDIIFYTYKCIFTALVFTFTLFGMKIKQFI